MLEILVTLSSAWESHGSASPGTAPSLKTTGNETYKRHLGPTEASYYLGSRGEGKASGVNDMYLHIGFQASSDLVQKERITCIWAHLLERHTLLASEVEYNGVDDIRFACRPPKDPKTARERASGLMEFRTSQSPEDLIAEYLNGPRALDDRRLSYLIISTAAASFEAVSGTAQQYDFFLFSTHFLGDGMALHTTANDFFTLLAGTPADGGESKNIEALLSTRAPEPADSDDEGRHIDVDTLALPMESKLTTPTAWGRMAWAGARVNFNRSQAKLIGGQAFARAKLGERHTVVQTLCYDSAKTRKMLSACKAHGVTIASAILALVNLTYIRSVQAGTAKGERDERLPMMLYSALNIRPWLKKDRADTYHIAISYYNIILPSFLPRSTAPSQTFWLRAQATKSQTSAVVKSPFLPSRAKLMALERERRAIAFQREDERCRLEKEKVHWPYGGAFGGIGVGFGASESKDAPAPPAEREEKTEPGTPSVALMGVSMLGNLDGMYAHSDLHGIKLHTLTTGSRQRPGALLLFAYTFAGKLWLSLGYDRNGLDEGVIGAWWAEMQRGVEEFLLA